MSSMSLSEKPCFFATSLSSGSACSNSFFISSYILSPNQSIDFTVKTSGAVVEVDRTESHVKRSLAIVLHKVRDVSQHTRELTVDSIRDHYIRT